MIVSESSGASYVIRTDDGHSRVTVRRYPNEVWLNVVDVHTFSGCIFILPVADFREWAQTVARMTDE